ncbi:MAG: glycosyl hydrolase 2 galactose-binding domain-containing protein, partial [Clostridia bacterium]
MKQTVTTHDFVYFTGKGEKKRDFSGTESALTIEERMDFLQHYAAAASRWNDDPRLDQKAVSDQEAELALQKAAGGADITETKCRRVLRFDTMQAQTAYKEPAYCGVHLYCGAKAEQEELIFPGRPIRPTPCAYLALEPKEEICVSFEVYIPKAYDCGQAEKCGDAQPGRLIELRCGTLDKVKLKFYNTGEIAVFQGSMWSPACPNIGHVRFDAWNTVEIHAGKTAAVTVNGVTTENLSCTISGRADGLFFDGTMFPRGAWRVRHITVDGAPYPFVANTAAEKAGEPREATLPYAVGSVQNRDRRLYLSKTFTVDDFDAAILHIETLDPCGKAWINGHLVLETDTFTENNVDITNYLQKGTNELKILVEPRAPEVYYFWHRHNDCYNGWFCGAVSVTLCAKQRITYMKVQTDSVHPHVKGHAEIKINENFCGSVRLYASKCFPEKGEEFWLGENAVSGKTVSIFFETAAQLWNTDAPVLYHIRAELVDKTGAVVDDYAQETGFRTICQKDGGIYLNDERILLNGALLMQFLPPFDEVPVNHNCPSGRQIAMQVMMLKKMNGNFMRLHLLGYGTNDARYARICDRLGMMLIWTTRFIDSLEELVWDDGMWREQNAYLEQVKAVINHPSIIMFEGSNEYHAKDIRVIDRMYDYFVDAMRSVDTSRLLTPCSHLYYGGGIYELGCSYYSEDGTMNQDGAPVRSGHGWVDPSVVRSANTYEILCGYGTTWEGMRKQPWRWQP